jgi:predicted amidohydrolase YtcJ
VPGIHDFHLHLAAMARTRLGITLDAAETFDDLLVTVRAAGLPSRADAWIIGRGWREAALDRARIGELEDVAGERPMALTSHDGHSMWASTAARRSAGITGATPDPDGGRIERDGHGRPTGVLREAALAGVEAVKPRLRGDELAPALREVLVELSGWGITSVTDAGDAGDRAGYGRYASLGDSFSTLHTLGAEIRGRLRVTLNLPVDALEAAGDHDLHSGDWLSDGLRVGWAKVYGDGALGSRTAALFEPYTCGDVPDTGILRHQPDELAAFVRLARERRIGLAIHAIGDRAVAAALDAVASRPRTAAVPDRIEHAQLVRAIDRPRFAALDVTASVQPIHATADRDMADRCWRGRERDAYAYRSLADAGARLAYGSDAPIEDPNPWSGFHAATRRHAPHDGRAPWHAEETLAPDAALAAMTIGAASAGASADLGHLRPGALADLAILDIDLAAMRSGAASVADARSRLTLIGGTESHVA